ncbi:hypothetical protein M0804_002606 [Polistes exclamans]|nr:hypothetical protein M0804_002606 [Polistes exclamans]
MIVLLVCNTLKPIAHLPCEKPSDFRGEQCAAFNDVPYSGQLLKWYPHYDPERPCSLICRGEQSLDNTVNRLQQQQEQEQQQQQQQQGSNKKTLDRDPHDDLQFDTDETIVVQLAEKVEDGTRCFLDGHDICINGECMILHENIGTIDPVVKANETFSTLIPSLLDVCHSFEKRRKRNISSRCFMRGLPKPVWSVLGRFNSTSLPTAFNLP